MTTIFRTTNDNSDYKALVQLLDKDIATRDGEEHVFYAQFNKSDSIKHVVLIYDQNNSPLGCGAFKHYDKGIAEIKRMYVNTDVRGKGIASKVLHELEKWAKEEQYMTCILETGKKYPEAIALYLKNGFRITGNYGQYIGIEDSVCFQKEL
jgi:GNAT superfamily N-acetyltransferase